MLKTIKERVDEEYEIYSDFTNTLIQGVDELGPLSTISINSEYCSKYDGLSVHFHLDDEDMDSLLEFLKQKMYNKNLLKEYNEINKG